MNINIASDLGGVIRSARKARGWNQAHLASLVGIHQPDLSDIERDPRKTNFGLILKICAALGIKMSVNDLPGQTYTVAVNAEGQKRKPALRYTATVDGVQKKQEANSGKTQKYTAVTGKKVNF